MAATHPCPSCGWTLRWAPEQGSWVCDRCGTVLQAQQAAPQPAPAPVPPQSSGLAPGWQRPVSTNAGFGGSAAASSPIGRSPSQPPGVYQRSPSQPPVAQAAPAPAQPPGSASPPNYAYGQPPGSASQASYGYGQPPPGAQPANPYTNAGFGGSATAAAPSQFGVPAFAPPQPGGFGGAATAAQPPGDPRTRAPSNAPYGDPRAASQPAIDRASQSAPSIPQQAPQPGYGPGGYPAYTPPSAASEPLPPVARSKRGLYIAIGAVVAIAAGIVIAVVVGKGGGHKPGLDSADEVATQTLAALAAGDDERLGGLVVPLASDLMTCDEPDPRADKLAADVRDQLQKAADKAKGLTVELVKLGDARTTRYEKGKQVGPKGCTAASDFATHDHDAVLKIKSGERPAQERTVRIAMVELDGKWFLSNAPKVQRPGDCAAATRASIKNNAARWRAASLGDAAMARLDKAISRHCAEDGWPDETIVCLEDAKGSDEACLKMLTGAQVDKLTKHVEQIILEDAKSREVPTVAETPPTVDPTVDPTVAPVDPTAPGAGAGSGVAAGSGSAAPDEPVALPSVCDDYKAEIDKLARCRRVKADIKRGQLKRYQLTVDGWDKVVKKTEELRRSTEEICRKGVEQLVDLRKTHCR